MASEQHLVDELAKAPIHLLIASIALAEVDKLVTSP
jgi:hypothetical protein